MSQVGQAERRTQNRIVGLFQTQLDYRYLGDWKDRANNSNIETDLLTAFLRDKQGYSDNLINKALYELNKITGDRAQNLYSINKEFYNLLRYGANVKPEVGENAQTVQLINWKQPLENNFAIAEEVTVKGENTKRPDIVIYVNGIALGVLELKRSTISISEGIRQNLDNQKSLFIQPFFTTMQLVMAGNDTEGLRYGAIETPEKYYLTWKEDSYSDIENPLDRHLLQLCEKNRFLELIHDFIVFDLGTKKICRQHQYFGIKAAQDFLKRREGGIIWHSQGSGKSLTMVWLAKWIREHLTDSRVLIITDREELDAQIEGDYSGVNERIYRTQSSKDLINALNDSQHWLICSLIHKFGRRESDYDEYIEGLKSSISQEFTPKRDIYIFVDECHRTQSGKLHQAMKQLIPNAVLVGFTGTPLLKSDKQQNSTAVFGKYIHTYKYDEAVRDKVVLDLRYEARNVEQNLTSKDKIDIWFAAKTKGLTEYAQTKLKQRWGTMQKVLSSKSRLEKIVADIVFDFETKDRLADGRGNAILVASSIYQACRYYDLFQDAGFPRCAIITSYNATTQSIKGESTGEDKATEKLEQYEIYQKMLQGKNPDTFEEEVKQQFIKEPAQMKLLIVVDKLLTGFDAPSATYLYIDKTMRDHGLFQAICRVNRLDGDDKEYGYIIDYKDLFKSLEGAVQDYTSGAFDGYDKEDVMGLLEDRLGKARERLEEALEAVRALCEPVEAPKDQQAYFRYFSSKEHGNAEQLKDNEPQRLSLYKLTAALVRAYADIASEMKEAGYSEAEAETIKNEVTFYENLRTEVKLHSGDAIDLKRYEPAMRHLIDTYIRAEESKQVSSFDDLSLVELIVERGADAVKALPEGIRKNKEAAAETIENNVRKLIIDESPINPKYYERMSELLEALIEQRKQAAFDYAVYLAKVVELTRQAKNGPGAAAYPRRLDTLAKRALYDNLDKDETLALAVHEAVYANRQDDWRNNPFKIKRVENAIKAVLKNDEPTTERVLELVKNQHEY